MAELPKVPGITTGKRAAVDKDKSRIFAIIAASAVVTVGCLMVAKGFMDKGNYHRRVIEVQQAAKDQLVINKDTVAQLKEKYNEFKNRDPNLISGSPTGDTDKDGDNGQLILDALPDKYDFPAFAASLEKLLDGYASTTISGTDQPAAALAAAPGQALEIPFSITVPTDYNGFKVLTSKLQRSIRPLHFTKLTLTANNTSLNVQLDGKTYWQPQQGISITEAEVQ